MRRPALALAALALAACTRGGSGPPDLILTGGRIFTADSGRPWAEALAVRGDRILAVGSTDSVRRLAGPRTRALDLGGRTVIPGLNDAHAHPGPELRGTRIAAAAGDPGLLEVVRALAAASRVRPRGTWLLATVGERVLDDPRSNRFFLDSVVPDHPVVLESWSGHVAILNSATLGTLGIGHDTPDPPGGHYGRAPGSGVLDGRLTEYAWWNARRRLSSSVPDSASRADLQRYADAAARFGITTVQDMNSALTTARAVALLRTVDVAIRWRVIRFPMTRPGGRDVADARAAGSGGRLGVSGLKYILDGTPVEQGAAMRRPYADRPGWYGELDFPPETLKAIIRETLASREQLLVHAVGDSAIALLLRLLSGAAPESTWHAARPRIEHADFLTADLLPSARRLGVVVVQNPAHFTIPDLIRRRYGPGRSGAAQPLRSLLAAGVPIALGSDGPMNPYLNLMFAVTHPVNPAEALTREQAILAYTRGSAYAEFAEREKGMLTPGMLADLAVLSQDIFAVPLGELSKTESVLTLVGGKVAYDAGVVK
jgi:predicted amidohydrolase YtcJ